LDKAEEDKIPVFYITIGTECIWQQWSIKAIYDGLKDMNCRVVWGLKEPFKLPEENEKFWVRAWLPQIEALSHSAVKACLTHGGMGGCMECIGSETPAITFPHFADQ
jgi:UDP:flavonoid glycosyltransferase YjiC (YdhE family)